MSHSMTRLFTSDKPDLQEILRKKKPNERSVDICVDPSLVRQYNQIREEITRIQSRTRKTAEGGLSDTTQREISDLEAKLIELEPQIEEATVTFIARDPGKKRFSDLITAHPPTDEQKKEWKESGALQRQGPLDFNTDTFVSALMSLCYIQPEMSIAQADEICDDWGNGEVTRLFQNALMACNEVTSVPKFKSGTEPTSSTALNSTTALNGESLTPDS